MPEAINEVAILAFLDKNKNIEKGLIFSARDEVMERFAMDRSTATAIIAKYQQMRGKLPATKAS